MPDKPGFDTEQAHEFFSTHCFNKAWELIEKTDRTADEAEEMIQLAHASLWHWSQLPECSDKNPVDRLLAAFADLRSCWAIVPPPPNMLSFVWRKRRE